MVANTWKLTISQAVSSDQQSRPGPTQSHLWWTRGGSLSCLGTRKQMDQEQATSLSHPRKNKSSKRCLRNGRHPFYSLDSWVVLFAPLWRCPLLAGIRSWETALHASPCPQRRLPGEKLINQPAYHPAGKPSGRGERPGEAVLGEGSVFLLGGATLGPLDKEPFELGNKTLLYLKPLKSDVSVRN